MNKWLSNCGQRREEREREGGNRERKRCRARKIWKNRLQDIAGGEYVLFKSVLPHPLSAALRKNLREGKKKKERKRKGKGKYEDRAISRYLSFKHRLTMYNSIVYLPWKCTTFVLNTIAVSLLEHPLNKLASSRLYAYKACIPEL